MFIHPIHSIVDYWSEFSIILPYSHYSNPHLLINSHWFDDFISHCSKSRYLIITVICIILHLWYNMAASSFSILYIPGGSIALLPCQRLSPPENQLRESERRRSMGSWSILDTCHKNLIISCKYVYMSISLSLYIYIYLSVYIYKYTYVCMYVFMYLCMYVCMHACMYVYM